MPSKTPPLNANQQGVSGNRDLVYISTKINKMNMAMPFVITYYNIQVAPSVVLSAIFFTGETILRPSKFLKIIVHHMVFFPFFLSFFYFSFLYHTFTTKHFAPVVNFLNADFTPWIWHLYNHAVCRSRPLVCFYKRRKKWCILFFFFIYTLHVYYSPSTTSLYNVGNTF